jgi:amino acid transporter
MNDSSGAPTPPAGKGSARLARTIGTGGFFTLSFGSIVGSGWVVVLGDWLQAGGPGGAIVAFLAGGLVMTIIAAAFAELASHYPRAGGEFVYILEGLGPKPAFLMGWLLTLSFVAFTAFEGIALAWFIETLLPAFQGPAVYSVMGQDIRVSALALGAGGAVLFTALNYFGSRLAILFQRVVTYAFIACALGLILAGFTLGDFNNAAPLFAGPEGRSWTIGAFWVFATSMVFLNGFQSAIYAVEERNTGMSVAGVSGAMIAGVLAAVLFYCLLILSASSAMPWQSLLGRELPSAAAFGALTENGILRTVVLVGAAISLLKTWNALHLAAARLILAQARLGFLPTPLARVHPRYGTPSAAVLFVGTCTIVGVLLGRGAIVPIVNMSAVCSTTTFILCLIVLLRLRRSSAERPSFMVPGGFPVLLIGMAGALVAASVALFEPMWTAGGVPLEWYLLIAWALIGAILWAARGVGKRAAA